MNTKVTLGEYIFAFSVMVIAVIILLIYGLIKGYSSIADIRAYILTKKIEGNEECYRFLMTPQDGRGYIYPNTHKVTPEDIGEYYNCGENENFQNDLNRFNYKNYGFENNENLFIGKGAIDDLCYTFYYKKTLLIDIIGLDCTEQYIYAFQKGHLTIDDYENDSKEKRTQILNNRVKNNEDLEIIEKINKKFNTK